MKRQIKFRAKILNSDQWIYGYYYFNTPTREHRIISPVEKSDEMIGWNIDPDTIGQFTGLTDKNGKEIYEGDIITLETWLGKHVVMFVDGAFCFKEIGADTYCNDIHYVHHAGRKQAHVIGNIHDNPIEE